MRGIYVAGVVFGVIGAVVAASVRRTGLGLDLSRFTPSPVHDEMIAKEEETRAELMSLRRDVLSRLDDLRSQLPKGTEQPRIENEMSRIRNEVESMEHELLSRLDTLRSEVGSHQREEHGAAHARKPTRPERKSGETRKAGS